MKKMQVFGFILDGFAALAFIAWFFFPVGPGPSGLWEEGNRILFIPYTMLYQFRELQGPGIFTQLLYALYFIPALGLYRIISFFFAKKMGALARPWGMFLSILRILATLCALYAYVLPMLAFADSIKWFLNIQRETYISLGVIVLIHIISVVVLAKTINNRNPVYREYREFKSAEFTADKKTKKERKKKNRRRAVSAVEVLFRIRTKLFFAFIGVISLILVLLSGLMLRNYRETLLQAVGDTARTQVEQANASYRVNLGDTIAMFEYLNRQNELNKNAEFAFESLTLYTNLKTPVYFDDLDSEAPDFAAEFSLSAPGEHYPAIDGLPGDLVQNYARQYKKNPNVISIRDGSTRSFKYIGPITMTETVRTGDEKMRRERLLGFSIMIFSEDVILRSFFRTKISVFVFTTMFMYLAIILTYLVGNYIVNPLLFLRMNVRKISDVLSTMISGQSRISSSSLVYKDCVTSRDEIKSLSSEINDMVTVIRGIVPYISASTLKQAEKGKASTSRKELTFLFTDIRGFTTMCEGMKPEEVVTVLNSYLDLETEIILNNHGDVDKFVGDEMMAFFEGPLKEVNACRAAMQIRHAMMEEKERREKDRLPIVSIGIGINSGDVIFGSVGARDRMDFTSIGDTVNIAARLESANKAYGSKSIITETVYKKIKGKFLCRELDFITVKGKTEPVRIYELLQEIPRAHPKLVEIKTLFERGLEAYRTRNWAKARTAFSKNVELYEDAPSKVYLERIEHFTANPPPRGWDGVFRMLVK